jgi:adrenodoxin-NADP+ reductase
LLSLSLCICRLIGDVGNQQAVGTGEFETIDCDMALISIGYKGVNIGVDDQYFDEKNGIMKNEGGKIKNGLYTTGWLKRGPSGIIGSNIVDARETVSRILTDYFGSKEEGGKEKNEESSDDNIDSSAKLMQKLEEEKIQYVDWSAYKKIDAAEKDVKRKRSETQIREKFTSIDEMLKAASGTTA